MNAHINNHIVIILAGGQSSRAETTKGLRVVQQQVWIDKQITFFIDQGFGHIFVGLGYDREKYLNQSIYLKGRHSAIQVAVNHTPEKGAFSTLKRVIKSTQKLNWHYAIIIHIDHAIPSKKTINKLIQHHKYHVVKPLYERKSGHPIMINKYFAEKLLQQSDDSQLNKEIKKLNIDDIYWQVVDDPNILSNLNTEQQWHNYLRSYL